MINRVPCPKSQLNYITRQGSCSPSAVVPVAPFTGAVLPRGTDIPATAPNAVEVELTPSWLAG